MQVSYEAIAAAGDRLNKAGLFRVIPQRLPYFADSAVYAVVCIKKDVFPPDPLYHLLARDQLPFALNQADQDFSRDTFQLQRTSLAA